MHWFLDIVHLSLSQIMVLSISQNSFILIIYFPSHPIHPQMVLGINDSYQVMAAQITSCCQPWEAATNNQHTTPRVIVEGDEMWWTPKSEKGKIIHFEENAMLVTKHQMNDEFSIIYSKYVHMKHCPFAVIYIYVYIIIYQWVFWSSFYSTFEVKTGFTLPCRVMMMQWWCDPSIWWNLR